MDNVTFSSELQRDPARDFSRAAGVAHPGAHAPVGRLFFFTASFIAAESLLAISTHTTRPWQWLALLLMIATGLICTLFIARHRFALGISGFVVMALAVLTRLPALFAAPLFDDDYFRFLWDGYQLLSGASPYATTPASHFSQTVGNVAWERVLSGVNHPDVATIYGPSLQALFWVAALVGGASPIVLKALFVAADIGLVALLLRVGAAPWMVMLYVVNPLAIKEIGFSLHPDGVIALWLTLALFSLQRGRVLRAALYAAAVVCAKLPLLLLAATLNLKNPLHRRMAAWCLLLSVCTYLPFLFPDPALPFIGLREFADVWRYNALGFHLFEWFAGPHARVLLAVFYGACALAAAYVVGTGRLATATATVLFFALILLTAPTVNPWYWLPLMPLSIAALHHERVWLVTPWIGSFTLLFGYVSGAMLMELGLGDSRAPFSVAPAATLIQVVVMGGAFAYDLFTAVSGRDRVARSAQPSTLTQT